MRPDFGAGLDRLLHEPNTLATRRAIRDLVHLGYRPYIVIDDWEETGFRNRFAASNRVGRLDWRPLVRVIGNPEVRIYDPEGRAE